jgi:hypothetical protein
VVSVLGSSARSAASYLPALLAPRRFLRLSARHKIPLTNENFCQKMAFFVFDRKEALSKSLHSISRPICFGPALGTKGIAANVEILRSCKKLLIG